MAHTEEFNGGIVTNQDSAKLRPGQLQQALNAYYKPGDKTRIHNQRGVSTFGTVVAGSAVKWTGLAKFDSGGTDRLLALSGTAMYSATPGTTGTFASLFSGLSSSTTKASMVHAVDRWYVATGYDRNRVISADGSLRYHGMLSPDEQPTVTPATGAVSSASPTARTGSGWDNAANADDGDTDTFAKATLSAAGSSAETWTTWPSDTGTRYIVVYWSLAGAQIFTETPDADQGGSSAFGIGGTIDSGFNVTVKIETSVDSGTTWTTMLQVTRTSSTPQKVKTTTALSAANSNLVHVRVTLTYNSGTSQATLRVYEVSIDKAGSSTTNFSSTTGFVYAIAEYDSSEGIAGPVGPPSAVATFSTQNYATITLPSAPQNTNADTYIIYRSTDGGEIPATLGEIDRVPVTDSEGGSNASYIDTFERWGPTTQPLPRFGLYQITFEQGTIEVPRDTPPPAFQFVTTFHGRIIGIPPSSRALHASVSGLPESFPETSVIKNFPMPENDRLVAAYEVGSILVIAAEGVMMTLTEWPEGVRSLFKSEVDKLAGVPGCVGEYAITPFSTAGEDRLAWVSPFGVHITNGYQHDRISDSIDWLGEIAQENLSSASLFFDQQNLVLVLACNSRTSADNDTAVTTPDVEYWFHMDMVVDGKPVVTGPHSRPTAIITAGLVSGTWRRWSAHPTAGTVGLWEGGTGAAMTVQGRRLYNGWDLMSLDKGTIRHGDFGNGTTGTVRIKTGRDAPGTTQQPVPDKSISLAGHGSSEFNISRAGEWVEWTVTTPAGALSYLTDIRLAGARMGEAGGKATP